MVFDGRIYNVLVVSSSDKFNGAFKQLISDNHYYSATYVGSIASAKRGLSESSYDFVVINAPLPDDFGTKLAIDICADKSTVALMLVKAELHEEIHSKVLRYGIFTLPKPTSAIMISQSLMWMSAARERLRRLEKKTVTIEEKMEEIRLVNRAKWLLIENLKMTEPDAHHYIEKQAMDRCTSKRNVAESILKTYQNQTSSL